MKPGAINRRDKGASLIEAALVLPLLIGLAIGISEIGFLGIDYITVSNAAREGARTGAAAADFNEDGVTADDLILESVEEAACNLKFGKLVEVSIFKADSNGEPVSPAFINKYEPITFGVLECGGDPPASGLTCTNGCKWKPEDRSRDPDNLDVLGVEVVFKHETVTGLFPLVDNEWSETAVMQIEPDTSVGQ